MWQDMKRNNQRTGSSDRLGHFHLRPTDHVLKKAQQKKDNPKTNKDVHTESGWVGFKLPTREVLLSVTFELGAKKRILPYVRAQ